jgi:glutamate/tyrosine decarboxylase-like PLP-dependent enzyme
MRSKYNLLTELLENLANQTSISREIEQQLSSLLNEANKHNSEQWASHMTPATMSHAEIGKLLGAIHNGNLLSADLYPALQQLERQTISWLQKRLGFSHAYFTNGSSAGNLEALWYARDAQPNRPVVYAGSGSHYSIPKACAILGLEFITIESDSLGRMLPKALQKQCAKYMPTAIVLNAGNTSTGELDPLEDCLAIAKQYDIWCHIDAAWGGALSFLNEFDNLKHVMRQANSLCFDPHKALAQPKPCGLICYQSPRTELNINAEYLSQQPSKSISGSYGGELFLSLWLSWQAMGDDYFVKTIQNRLQQATLFAEGLAKKGYWYNHSSTGIVCFSPTEQSTELENLLKKGVFSLVTIAGKKTYRAVFASHSTSAARLLELINHH